MRPESGWLSAAERGSSLGIEALLAVCRLFGRRGGRLILIGIALWYALFGGSAVRASRDYLRRVQGRAGFLEVFRHILCFCQCTLDRVFLAQRRFDLFEIEPHGNEHLLELHRQGRGALLLGAHLGSFESLRAMSRIEDVPVYMAMHLDNARRLVGYLRRVDPDFSRCIVPIDPADPSFVFRLKELVDGGALVAVLADRVGFGERSVEVEFLGASALFPSGPYALASVLGCPVFMVWGLYRSPRRYDPTCVPFADEVKLPRGQREEAARELAQRYARRLEELCRQAPYNWFNFYDFWSGA
jgi:predicted LPLAT superfamily acyltransferase